MMRFVVSLLLPFLTLSARAIVWEDPIEVAPMNLG